MPMNEASAAIAADNLLVHILTNQTSFLTLTGPHAQGGKNIAEAIAAIRLGLIEMYKTQP